MKKILNILLLCTLSLAELPPPYSQRGFRPSPQFSSTLQSPQTIYGPPRPSKILDIDIPSKFTIEQLIRITEQLQLSRGKPKPQQFNSYLPPPRQPQITYGLPNQQSGFQSQNRPSKFGFPSPQTSYGPPSKQQYPASPNLSPPNQFGPSQGFNQQSVPQNSYSAPFNQQLPNLGTSSGSFAPSQQVKPHNTYGVPDVSQLSSSSGSSSFGSFSNPQTKPQETYGAPSFQQQPNLDQSTNFASSQNQQFRPQTAYGAPPAQQLPRPVQSGNFASSNPVSRPQLPPSTSYGVPDIRNLESFGNTQDGNQNGEDTLRLNLLNDLKKQNLPYKPSTGFNPQPTENALNVNQQYLPPQQGSTVLGENRPNVTPTSTGSSVPQTTTPESSDVAANYLPPTSTPKSVATTTARVRINNPVNPTSGVPNINYDYDYDLQSTDSPSSQDESETGPNISISNAVAGTGGFFYLQQPDGRLQKVTLQKAQDENSKPEEFVANYYFQNIPALPENLYAPLINIGAFVKK